MVTAKTDKYSNKLVNTAKKYNLCAKASNSL